MYNVYWMLGEQPCSKKFGINQLNEVMKFMEELRAVQRAGSENKYGEKVSFVTLCSEHPDSVGNPGVDVTGPDYNWKKRRI